MLFLLEPGLFGWLLKVWFSAQCESPACYRLSKKKDVGISMTAQNCRGDITERRRTEHGRLGVALYTLCDLICAYICGLHVGRSILAKSSSGSGATPYLRTVASTSISTGIASRYQHTSWPQSSSSSDRAGRSFGGRITFVGGGKGTSLPCTKSFGLYSFGISSCITGEFRYRSMC